MPALRAADHEAIGEVLRANPSWALAVADTGGSAASPCGSSALVCSGGAVTEIDLSHSGLTGPVPAALFRLGGLEELELQGNALSGPVDGIEDLASSLTYLRLDSNSLTGSFPADALGELEVARFDGNDGLEADVPLKPVKAKS